MASIVSRSSRGDDEIRMTSYGSQDSDAKNRRPFEREPSDAFLTSYHGHQPFDAKNRAPFEREQSGISYTSIPNTADGANLIPPNGYSYARPPQHLHRLVTNWWREVAAAILLIGSSLAIVATLLKNEGRPLSTWSLPITINALVSIYILLLRSSAGYLITEGLGHQKWRWFDEKPRPLYDLSLHDEASHGPYGALKLLARTSPRHVWHWLGCLLIFVALVIGPFSQQVIQYVDCIVPADPRAGPASIPRSNIFIGAGRHSGAAQITITQPEQAAINAGIFAPGGQVSFDCPSGNCTVPEYSTIGYCSETTDVSSSMAFDKGNFSYSYPGSNETEYIPGVQSYLPSGVTMLWLNGTGEPNLSTIARPDYDDAYQFMVGLPGRPYDAETGLAPAGCDDAADKETWRCKGYGAANSTLFPCIRTYRANVSDNMLTEELISETSSPGPFGEGRAENGRYVLSALNTSCLLDSEKDLLKSAGYTNFSTPFMPYNMTGSNYSFSALPKGVNGTTILTFENATRDRGCRYELDLFFHMSLLNILDIMFIGNLSGALNNDGYEVQFFFGTEVLQTLYNFGDFGFNRTESLFTNISDSLTTHMRMNPGNNTVAAMQVPAYGSQFDELTCVHVEWKWLTPSAILVVFTLLYTVGALLSLGSLSHGMRTWRSSPLPMIFHGPSIHTVRGPNEGNMQDIRDMERVARHTRVRLVPDANGEMRMQAQYNMHPPT